MEIQIQTDLHLTIPNIKIGIIHYNNITIEKSPAMLKGRLQYFQEQLFFELEKIHISEINEINQWRSIFKQIGKNPECYNHSAERLLRLIQTEIFLPSEDSATDLIHFFMLNYKIPMGIYDVGKIKDHVEFRIGQNEDVYDGLNGERIYLKQFLVSADAKGAFGSPYDDSKRTAISLSTTEALQIVYFPLDYTIDKCEKILSAISSMFTQINGGEAEASVLTCGNE